MPLIPIIFVSLLSLFASIDGVKKANQLHQLTDKEINFPLPSEEPHIWRTQLEIELHRDACDPWKIETVPVYKTYKHGMKENH